MSIISIRVIEKLRKDRVCARCNNRINKGCKAVRVTKKKLKLKNDFYHILCANNSKTQKIESVVLQYAAKIVEERFQTEFLIYAIENSLDFVNGKVI